MECLPVYFLSNADAESSIKPHSSLDLDKRQAGTQNNDRRGMVGGRDGGFVAGVVGVRTGLMVMVMAVIRKKAERQNCSEWLVFSN